MSLESGPLSKLRVVEGSAFVAAPLGGLTLAQLGAEVIRFDQIGGGLDFHRWPLTQDKQSLFWAGLNRGKKSVQVDLKSTEGRELISNLITSPGANAGIFITNLAAKGELSYEELCKKRPDLIMVMLTGNYDGSTEVDYTVHPSFGYPLITGPSGSAVPVNSVLPTWDLLLGNMVAIAVLVAIEKRRETGTGDLIRIALSDVALSVVGALGRLSQAHLDTEESAADGNYLYGAFGTNFTTSDNSQIMLVGLTHRQWESIKSALNLGAALRALEMRETVNFDDESQRYIFRREIAGIIEPIIRGMSLSQVSTVFEEFKVAWSKYQTFKDLLKNDPRASSKNPIFHIKNQAGIGDIPNIASPIRFTATENIAPQTAPTLGEHTSQVLQEILGLSPSQIDVLKNNKTIA